MRANPSKTSVFRVARLIAAALFWLCASRVSAQPASVPPALQAQLLATVAPYDRNMAKRAAGSIKILVLTKRDEGDSMRTAKQLTDTLAQIPLIGGLPHIEINLVYESVAKLASICREQRPSIVFVTPGLGAQAAELAKMFTGSDVLTVASNATDVENGIVLGFDVISGKPKLVVNLRQAHKQNVAFNASVLKMMKVLN